MDGLSPPSGTTAPSWRTKSRYTNEADMPCIVTAYIPRTAHKTAPHTNQIGFASPTPGAAEIRCRSPRHRARRVPAPARRTAAPPSPTIPAHSQFAPPGAHPTWPRTRRSSRSQSLIAHKMLTAIILRSSRHIEVEVPDAGDEGVPHERRASDDGLRHNVLVRDRESQRDNYVRQRRTRRPRLATGGCECASPGLTFKGRIADLHQPGGGFIP